MDISCNSTFLIISTCIIAQQDSARGSDNHTTPALVRNTLSGAQHILGAEQLACLQVPGQDMKANGPGPSIGHMLCKGSGREPHGNAQEKTPCSACKWLQSHVVDRVQNQHQQAPVQHRSAAQSMTIRLSSA